MSTSTHSPYQVESQTGSLWHRWDPHIHTPGTALNDQYTGPAPWESFLTQIEASSPPVRALGITDYFGIERYEQVVEHKQQGRLPNVGLIFPNVELRLSIETSKASAVNIHLLFSPEASDHVDRINRFLLEFEFKYLGDIYRCQRSDLIRLGRAHNAQLVDDDAARSEGANQFKVNFDQLTRAWEKNEWARKNALIAVAGGEKDGTSGLRDQTASFAALRKSIEGFSHIIFSANPKQVTFWLGKGSTSIDDLEADYHGRKPCLHGSDAHHSTKVAAPDESRFCWIKGDLTFESLRQTCIEPEERVFIGVEPPRGALEGQTIGVVSITNAPWLSRDHIELNTGLVAIIGARGSGKTALAEMIAAGGLALSRNLNAKSFIIRANEYLCDSEAKLQWKSGETTCNNLAETDTEELLDSPHVRYLSQQFVDQLCSAEGLNDALVEEIERVIFNAHPLTDRLGTDSFKELLALRLEASGQKRERQQQTLAKASANLADERIKKAGLSVLEKDRDEKQRAIVKDKTDRQSLVAKGSEKRTKRLDEISFAVDVKRQQVDRAKLENQALLHLESDVMDFRDRQAPEMLAELKELRKEAGLSVDDWDAFKVDYVGKVDTLLTEHLKQAKVLIEQLQGPAKTDPQIQPEPDLAIQLIGQDVNLPDQTLSLLEREQDRIRTLVGVDAQKSKRYTALSDKITRAETAFAKVVHQIDDIKGADERIRELAESRRTAYAGVFEAIVEEEKELTALYAPIKQRIEQAAGSLSKLSFSVRRIVDIEGWAEAGEALLDLRTSGPFKGRGELLRMSREHLLDIWTRGDAEEAAKALLDFVKENEGNLRTHRPNGTDPRVWARSVSDWLYGTDHISVGYGLQYDDVNIEQLSPGTRGIVLLLLYLAIDAEDDRPLIIDQPEENLDPQSVFQELVPRFREAKQRRQIIIVTHNANLVVNTDADQVIVATCGPHRRDQLPLITYDSGGLENPHIRKHVCDVLEGGERAFKERAKRLRLAIPSN